MRDIEGYERFAGWGSVWEVERGCGRPWRVVVNGGVEYGLALDFGDSFEVWIGEGGKFRGGDDV